jgi:hypothetical protein
VIQSNVVSTLHILAPYVLIITGTGTGPVPIEIKTKQKNKMETITEQIYFRTIQVTGNQFPHKIIPVFIFEIASFYVT